MPTPKPTKTGIIFCPRCDRGYSGPVGSKELLDKVIKHVAEQHPDHDALWYETHSIDHPKEA